MSINLQWSDHIKPNDDWPYDHIISLTPFGRFVLTWKSWKENGEEECVFDETPWNEFWNGNNKRWFSIEGAKQAAETELIRRINLLTSNSFDDLPDWIKEDIEIIDGKHYYYGEAHWDSETEESHDAEWELLCQVAAECRSLNLTAELDSSNLAVFGFIT